MRRASILFLLLLAGCIPGPHSTGPRFALPNQDDPKFVRQCLIDMDAMGAKYQRLPDRAFPNSCSATAAVKLVAIGIPVTNLGAMKCAVARPFTQWIQQAVQQAAQARFGTTVSKIESYGTYVCRPVNNVAGNRMSEHGRADAVDIAAFTLANGRRITVKADWNGPDPAAQAFLRDLHAAACRRFNIVMGPLANSYHQDHFHFDMGNGRYCR